VCARCGRTAARYQKGLYPGDDHLVYFNVKGASADRSAFAFKVGHIASGASADKSAVVTRVDRAASVDWERPIKEPAMARLLLLVAIALGLVGGGCILGAAAAGAAIGVGTYSYLNNELTRVYQAPYEAVVTAAEGALQAANVTIEDRRDTAAKVVFDGTYHPGDVDVVVQRQGDRSTLVRVSVGNFETDGNRAAAETIHRHIERLLSEEGIPSR
jgi:hypothetical protein